MSSHCLETALAGSRSALPSPAVRSVARRPTAFRSAARPPARPASAPLRSIAVLMALLLVAALACGSAGAAELQAELQAERTLRVCADPDNLPYSSADESGFENRIAQLVAAELHARLRYEWQPQRRGFVRKTLGADLCDVFIGVPAGFERVRTTRSYYRSGYVFVTRAGSLPLDSFDDPRLPTLSIGVQLIGDDLAATPPGYALARHGAVEHVVGYTVYGDGPAAARAIDDLAAGRLDAALLWGPQAGYFAVRSPVALRIADAQPPADVALPFDFAIAMGVRKSDPALQQALDAVIERRGAEITAILDRYGVPRRADAGPTGSAARARPERGEQR